MAKSDNNKSPAAEYVDPSTLKPWVENPRDNDSTVDEVAESIRRFGFGNPILARREDGEIIAGHTRLKAAQKLGLKVVPVRYLDLDPVDAHLLALADNKVGELSSWKDDVLAAQLVAIREAGRSLTGGTGFNDEEVERLLTKIEAEKFAGVDEDEADLTPPQEPKSRPGEVYQLGPHRLMCGDSLCVTDMEKLLDGQRVDLLWTDPPYNIGYVGKTKDALTIENDKMSDEDFRQFLVEAFSTASTVMKDGAVFYIAHADTEGYNFRGAVRDVGWKLASCLIWVKNSLVMGRGDYHWRHEPILYGWKEGAAHHALSDRKQDTIWECDRPSRNAEHPTMKPLPLIERAINNSTNAGDRMLDCFGGSGSTLIAAAKTGRIAYLMELDPRYCDVIRKRWDDFVAKAEGRVNESRAA